MSYVSEAGGACGGICMRVAIGTGMAESIPSGLRGSPVSPVEGGPPRATNGSSLLSILHWETGAEAVGEAHCSHSKVPWSCRLMAMVMSLGGSMVLAREGIASVQ